MSLLETAPSRVREAMVPYDSEYSINMMQPSRNLPSKCLNKVGESSTWRLSSSRTRRARDKPYSTISTFSRTNTMSPTKSYVSNWYILEILTNSIQVFRNPKPELLEKLRDTGDTPETAESAKKRGGDAKRKKDKFVSNNQSIQPVSALIKDRSTWRSLPTACKIFKKTTCSI